MFLITFLVSLLCLVGAYDNYIELTELLKRYPRVASNASTIAIVTVGVTFIVIATEMALRTNFLLLPAILFVGLHSVKGLLTSVVFCRHGYRGVREHRWIPMRKS